MEWLIAIGQVAALAGAIVGWVREYRKRKQIEDNVRMRLNDQALTLELKAKEEIARIEATYQEERRRREEEFAEASKDPTLFMDWLRRELSAAHPDRPAAPSTSP